MAAEYTFYLLSEVPTEPLTLDTGVSYTFVITNTGDEAGTDLGFYLSQGSTLGEITYPSATTPEENLDETIYQGDLGYGLVLVQGLTSTTFEKDVGDRSVNKIPLTIGTGTLLNELEPGASIEITLTMDFDPLTSSETLYVDLILE